LEEVEIVKWKGGLIAAFLLVNGGVLQAESAEKRAYHDGGIQVGETENWLRKSRKLDTLPHMILRGFFIYDIIGTV
jgi:hypothetical protein